MVPRLRPRVDRDYWPLVARASLIAVCGLVTALSDYGATVALAPSLLILLAAGLGTVPVPASVPSWLQPVTETLAVAVVVGALRPQADLFLPYLLVPLAAAGLSAGLGAAMVSAGLASAVLLLTQLIKPVRGAGGDALSPLIWVLLFVAVGLVAAWARRVTLSQRPPMEPAYADAHRLLSELHVVARQLSLGLDPPTLAAALVDELRAVVGPVSAGVLIRSGAGRFVPLVGDVPTAFAESVVVDAWLTAALTRRSREQTVAALPVTMGERVVAVVVLLVDTDQELPDDDLRRCQRVIAQAGPRLASALLFDDVRRLATVDERMRLAREIHDGIAQDMASVGYLLDDIARDIPDDAPPALGERLATLREHLGELVGDLRLSIFDLRAGVDESIGLARTLGDYVQRVGSQAGLAVHVSTEESTHRLPVAAEVELLRIVQEAVTNVRRHAGARNLWLTVHVEPPRAEITVADDGRGLQPGRADSVGIIGMKERAQRIGAVLSVANRSQGGTEVRVELDPAHAALPGPAVPVSTGRRVRGRRTPDGPSASGHHESIATPHRVTESGVTSVASIDGGWPSVPGTRGGTR